MIMRQSYRDDVIERIRNLHPDILKRCGKTADEIINNERLLENLWCIYQRNIEEYDCNAHDAFKDAMQYMLDVNIDAVRIDNTQRPLDRMTYRQTSNYIANELGLDRKAIEGIISEKIESRNIEGMVDRHLATYFHKGATGFKASEVVIARIEKLVDDAIKTAITREVSEHIAAFAKTHVDAVMGSISHKTEITNEENGDGPAVNNGEALRLIDGGLDTLAKTGYSSAQHAYVEGMLALARCTHALTSATYTDRVSRLDALRR